MAAPDDRDDEPPVTDTPPAADQAELVQGQPIDLRALAEKVYARLKQELRLERERLGRKHS